MCFSGFSSFCNLDWVVFGRDRHRSQVIGIVQRNKKLVNPDDAHLMFDRYIKPIHRTKGPLQQTAGITN